MDNSYFDELNKEKKRKAELRHNKIHTEGIKRNSVKLRFNAIQYGKKSYKRKMRFNNSLNEKYEN